MENGRWFLSPPAFPGLWADSESIEAASIELKEVLEEWIVLALHRGDWLPVLGSYRWESAG